MGEIRKIDIHVHGIPEADLLRANGTTYPLPHELRKMYDRLGIEYGILLPPGSAPEGTGDRMSQREARQLVENHPEVYRGWFCNLDPRQGGNGPDTDFVRYLEYYRSRGAVAMGEVTANVYLDDERMVNLLRCCEKTGMPVLFHFGNMGHDYGVVDEEGFPRLRRIMKQMPNLKVIGHSPKFWADIRQVEQMMEEFSNLYCEFSSISGGKAILSDPEFTWSFFAKFPNRIFYATDLHSPDNLEKYDIYQRVVDFLDEGEKTNRISEENYRKICRENALRLLGGTL